MKPDHVGFVFKVMPVLVLFAALALAPTQAPGEAKGCTTTPFGVTCRKQATQKPTKHCNTTPFGVVCSLPPSDKLTDPDNVTAAGKKAKN